jgi:hypothetical protein
VRKLGLATVSAVLVGTIAVIVPSGVAHGAPAVLPDPISGRCAANEATDCWRYITFSDDNVPNPPTDPPDVQGSRIILNHAGLTNLGNGVWWNRPLTMTGNGLSISFNAYLEGGDPEFHGSGMAFALVDSYMTPTPIPYFPTPLNFGASGPGLGFNGFHGDDVTPGQPNPTGANNLAVALVTDDDDDWDDGNDQVSHFNLSRVGLLHGRSWAEAATGMNVHQRLGSWYPDAPKDVSPSIYGGRAVPVSITLVPSATAGKWNATVLIDGNPYYNNVLVDLPPSVYIGFTSGVHERPNQHAISDISVRYGDIAAPTIGAPFSALPPTRILDTRESGGPVGPGAVRTVRVAGQNNVPMNAGAVVMNVTVDQPTADGFVTVYPTGQPTPLASNLNFVAGQTIANLVTAKIGEGGSVNIFNLAGQTNVLFDVVGWFPGTSVSSPSGLSMSAAPGGEFVPLAPARVLDTRVGIGAGPAPLGPGGHLDLQVTGAGPVPSSGVAAVVMNLTGTNTTAAGYLTAWPTGQPMQTTSNLNFVGGQSVPNLAVIPIGDGGKVSIFNFAGNTDVIGDVVGYYTAPAVSVPGGGLFQAMAPQRFLDTRPQFDNATMADGRTVLAQITGRAGIPGNAIGVVANVTATNTTVPGFLTVFPDALPQPLTSSLNFVGGEPGVPNLVMSKLGAPGNISIYNFSPGGTTDAIVDVVGWYAKT